jgi:TonB family protein
LLPAACCLLPALLLAQGAPRKVSVCVLDFGPAGAGRSAPEALAQALAAESGVAVNDRDESRVAARGAGYAGSLNLALDEARDLGGALGCDYYFLGRVGVEPRSTLARPRFFESYAAVLLVATETGKLVLWDAVNAEGVSAERAEAALPEALAARAKDYAAAIATQREQAGPTVKITVEDAPEPDTPSAQGLRLPAPYRRLTPDYPATAERVKAAGTVDVLVTLDKNGEPQMIETARWLGFGLEESVARTVARMRFRPATRNGVAIPLRVLLRYNFRPPAN